MSTSSTPPYAANYASSRPSAHAVVSPWPLVTGCAATVASVAIAIVIAVSSSAPIAMMGMTIPLVRSEYAWLSILGWILTPVVVIACYGWDVISQRNGRRRNRNIVLRPGSKRALLLLSGVGIVIGAWHILNISVPLSEWLGLA